MGIIIKNEYKTKKMVEREVNTYLEAMLVGTNLVRSPKGDIVKLGDDFYVVLKPNHQYALRRIGRTGYLDNVETGERHKLVSPTNSISSQHATITFNGQRISIQDTNSKNGIRLHGGEKVPIITLEEIGRHDLELGNSLITAYLAEKNPEPERQNLFQKLKNYFTR